MLRRAPMLAPSLGRCAATKTSPCTVRLDRVALASRAPYRSAFPALASPRRAQGTRTRAVVGSSPETKDIPSAGPLIKRSEKEGSSTMERVRVWAGMPSEGAVERLSVICAHCNAKLTPSQMDYAADESRLLPELRDAFRALTRDAATDAFLMRASRRPYLVNWGQAAACTFLRKFMSLTDANAMLGRGKMHVLSEAHVADLLGGSARDARRDAAPATSLKNTDTGKKKLLLDVGAGEGEVTEKFRDGGGFDVVVATEASAPMVHRLRQKKFQVVLESTDVSTVTHACVEAGLNCAEDGFDCVALLNVLDRCDTPFTLLGQLRKLLKDEGGVLVLAVVVPFRPFVEDGNEHRAPREQLGLDPNGAWEAGVNAIWEKVLKPSGFKVERLARVPYISEGDQKHGAYILDDAVFVLSKASG
jgi:SAM-dependent methyltransferase